MAYKNSGAMKFNDATDLVIRADPSGTVESCFNRANNVEYIDTPYHSPENVSVTLNNLSGSGRGVNRAFVYTDGNITGASSNIADGASSTTTVLKNSSVTIGTSYVFELVSGSADINGYILIPRGNCEANIKQA